MSEKTGSKSSLQSILSGAPLPILPAFDKNWSLEKYNEIQDEWKRKLIDYLRRLIGSFTAVNITNEISQGSSFTGQFNGDLGLNVDLWLEWPWPQCRQNLYGDGKVYGETEFDLDFPAPPTEKPFWSGVIPQLDLYEDDGRFIPYIRLDGRLEQWMFMRLTGFVVFERAEDYNLRFTHDNGIRVWLNDKLVLNDFAAGGSPRDSSIVFTPTSGQKVKIRIDQSQCIFSHRLRLTWASSSQPEEPIPYHFFFRR